MIRWNIIFSFVKKEFKQMLRDPRMRLVLFAAPVIMLLLFGYAVSTDVQNVNMVIQDDDQTQQSRALIEKFTSSKYFLPYAYIKSDADVQSYIDTGKAEVFLHIEKDFSKKIRSGKTTAVQLIVDGTDSGRAAVIVSYVNIITSGFSMDFLQTRIRSLMLSKQINSASLNKNIELKERILFNPELTSKNFFLPSVLALLVSMVTITLTSMSIVKERETGTVEQIIVSPMHPMELIAGKTIPFALVSFVIVFFITLITIFWFKVPFRGSFLFLMLSGFIYIFSTISVGLYLSTISKTQQQALLSTFLFFLPSQLFSGFVFPIYAMPVVMQWITLVNPMRYYIEIIRGIFLKGIGIDILWRDILMLTILGAVLFFLSSRRVSRRLE